MLRHTIKSVPNRANMARVRTHALQIMLLPIDINARSLLSTNFANSVRPRSKKEMMEISNVLINFLEARNAAALKFRALKTKSPPQAARLLQKGSKIECSRRRPW